MKNNGGDSIRSTLFYGAMYFFGENNYVANFYGKKDMKLEKNK